MPAGSGVFFPSTKFAFPRSYIWGFDIRVDTAVTQAGRFFTFPDGGTPGRVYTVSIAERVFVWSSNRYTLDFVIEDSYYQNTPDPTIHLMPYNLSYEVQQETARTFLVFYPFALPFVGAHRFELAGAPSDYWLPPFP